MRYFRNCANWDQRDVDGLEAMLDAAITISRRTFMQHVDLIDLRDLEQQLGYAAHPSQGLMMASDWHVTYHRSSLHGERVYFFQHSSIEYVFRRSSDATDLREVPAVLSPGQERSACAGANAG